MAREPTVARLDTETVRVLAHPLRMRIVGWLRFHGPATATQLAQALGESSGATSYHLRALARSGFVEDVPERGTGRERWWRAVHEMTSWRPEDFAGDPEARAAEEWLHGHETRSVCGWLDEWAQRRPQADPAWVSAADLSDYQLRMTPDEARSMLDELHEVVLRHHRAAEAAEAQAGDRPGAAALRLVLAAVPVADGPGDGR